MKNPFRNISIAIGLFLLLLTVLPSYAAAPQATTVEIAEYEQLVKSSYAMPDKLDFQRVRDIYTRLPGYTSYGVLFVEDFEQFSKGMEAGDGKVAEDVKTYSARHLALPEVHSRATIIYKKLGDEKSAQYEEWLLRKLIPLLMSSGDGKTAETAFKVITVSEEYMLARNFISKVTAQRVERKDSHVFDVLTGPDKQAGKPMDIWYNIDPIAVADY